MGWGQAGGGLRQMQLAACEQACKVPLLPAWVRRPLPEPGGHSLHCFVCRTRPLTRAEQRRLPRPPNCLF
jgi:hypothetical protein